MEHKIVIELKKKIIHYVERFEQTPNAFVFIIAILIGTFAGFGSAGFRYLIIFFQHIFYGPFDNYLERIIAIPWYWKLFVPAGAGLIIGPLIYFFKELKGHGVPEVMDAVVTKAGRLPPLTFLLKTLASAVTIASGGSVGREGPIVMIGASMGSNMGQLFGTSTQRMRTFVACGAAAGIAATFNAPIAGVIFSLEIIMGEIALEHFSPIVISSVIATAISRWLLGDILSFIVPIYRLASFQELASYAILGLVAALVAIMFTNFLYKAEDFADNVPIPEYLKPAIGGLIIGLLAIFGFPHIFGVGYETIDNVLIGEVGNINNFPIDRGMMWMFLLSLIFIKIFATSTTLATGGSGGVFAPSLFIGATMGGALGSLFNNIMPWKTGDIGAYAVVGMGALVAGTTHGPLTAMMIIFEMTGNYEIILPLMIACVTSTVVARAFQKDSIYTLKLVRRGVNIFEGREQNVLKSLYVREVMHTDFEKISENTPCSAIINLVSDSRDFYFPVINEKDEMTGVFSLNDVRRFMKEEEHLRHIIIAKDIAATDVITTFPDENLSEVIKKFSKLNIDEVPVMESQGSRRVVAMIKRKDVIDAYNREMIRRDIE